MLFWIVNLDDAASDVGAPVGGAGAMYTLATLFVGRCVPLIWSATKLLRVLVG
jgi:hypothetical protein